MPFFEDIGKKISNMGQTAVEKTKCSTETLRLNNQIREEQRLCKDLYQQIGQQYAQQYETNPDPAFESLMKQLHDAQERITSYQEQIQIKKAAVSQPQQSAYSTGCCCASCGAPLPRRCVVRSNALLSTHHRRALLHIYRCSILGTA